MNSRFTAWRHPLIVTLPLLAILAGCTGGDSAKPKTHALATYSSATWEALPAVSDSDLVAGFGSWRSACTRLKADAVWGPTCAAAANVPQSAAEIRAFLKQNLDVYGLRAENDNPNGLITGYYEPVYPGSLTPTATANVPVYGVPEDMIIVSLDSIYPELKGKRLRGRLEGRVLKPYDDAATIESKGVKAPVVAYLTDPMNLQFLQIQGSGRIQTEDGKQLRIAYADQNGHPYRPIGRWLVEQGELKKEDVTMSAISNWAKANPTRIPQLLASNPSYVFFTRNPDSNEGPRGSLNVPLTAGYSAAVDRKVIPLGSLLWLSTTKPDGTPLVRPVAAQDTGGAIAGEVRADLFWGTGDAAGQLAGDMKQQGQIWMLWPKGKELPQVPQVADKPYRQKIAAFGSSYRSMHSSVGAAAGCDLLSLLSDRHKEKRSNQPHPDKPHHRTQCSPVSQVADDVQQATGDKQHGQHIDRHQLRRADQMRNDHCGSKRGRHFKAVQLRGMGATGDAIDAVEKVPWIVIVLEAETAGGLRHDRAHVRQENRDQHTPQSHCHNVVLFSIGEIGERSELHHQHADQHLPTG